MANKTTPAKPSEPEKSTVKNIEHDGFKFKIDTDLLDDVEVLELIDRIESKNQLAAIQPLLVVLIGDEKYAQMKAHFVKKYDRFRITKLTEIYEVVIDNFDPKG